MYSFANAVFNAVGNLSNRLSIATLPAGIVALRYKEEKKVGITKLKANFLSK